VKAVHIRDAMEAAFKVVKKGFSFHRFLTMGVR